MAVPGLRLAPSKGECNSLTDRSSLGGACAARKGEGPQGRSVSQVVCFYCKYHIVQAQAQALALALALDLAVSRFKLPEPA